jgi:hypothetical protein
MEDTLQVVVEVDLILMEVLVLVVLVVVEQEIKVVMEQRDQQTLVVAVVDLVADLTLEEQVVLELL